MCFLPKPSLPARICCDRHLRHRNRRIPVSRPQERRYWLHRHPCDDDDHHADPGDAPCCHRAYRSWMFPPLARMKPLPHSQVALKFANWSHSPNRLRLTEQFRSLPTRVFWWLSMRAFHGAPRLRCAHRVRVHHRVFDLASTRCAVNRRCGCRVRHPNAVACRRVDAGSMMIRSIAPNRCVHRDLAACGYLPAAAAPACAALSMPIQLVVGGRTRQCV